MSRVFAAYLGRRANRPGARGIRRHWITVLGLPRAGASSNTARAARDARHPPRLRRRSGDVRTAGFVLASAAIFFASLALGVLEGVLPLHFADRLAQVEIGALYVGASGSSPPAQRPRAAGDGARS